MKSSTLSVPATGLGRRASLRLPIPAAGGLRLRARWQAVPLVLSGLLAVSNPVAAVEPLNGYHSAITNSADTTKWVAIDLGEPRNFDTVRLFPARPFDYIPGFLFPVRFKLEAAATADFPDARVLLDMAAADQPNPGTDAPIYHFEPVTARFVRLTVTRLALRNGNDHAFALAEMQVLKGKDILSKGAKTLALDSIETGAWALSNLTDGALESVKPAESAVAAPAAPTQPAPASQAQDPLATRLKASDPATWKPVPYQAEAPTGGVTLDDKGLFKPVMENNIEYLLNTFSVDHMLVPFRERAGIKDPPSDGKAQVEFWETSLRGSCAGRFLMGAGGTVRWIEHPELRKRMNELIDGIEACRRPDGYVLAFPPDAVRSEEPNYGRAWFTHGLIEAGIAGNPKAFKLLRGHADWFNQWDLLPKLTTICNNAQQGYIASTRTYFSPVGKPEDIQVAEKFWVQDWWVKRLAARDLTAVWQYPKPDPHSYLITSFEAYLDQYRATGEKPFLDATLGAWEMIIKHWQHVGGSMAICEGNPYLPDTLYTSPNLHTGETCGSVFWIKFNQRFHQLFPTEEKYVAEIEKSIYNACLPAQEGKSAILYHSRIEGQRNDPHCGNTCCEGQGTRIFGSLPEYIFSIARDGLYVNLFEPSSIRWKQSGEAVSLTMTSRFPYEPKVELKLGAAKPVAMKLRVRVPSWAAADMPVMVNGKQTVIGKPGTYVMLERPWADGDTVTFTLPMAFRATRYAGVDQIRNHNRYALEYGPILLAAAGPLDDLLRSRIIQSPASPGDWLIAKPDQALHFTVKDQPGWEFMPCWDLGPRSYTCYPVIDPITIEGITPFAESTAVKLLSTVAAAVIRYTTDGTEPTAQSPACSGSLKIGKTCVVRAGLFEGGKRVSPIVGRRFKRTAPVAITLLPPGLKPGDRYRLVFVTSTKTWAFAGADPAAPKSLDDYNAFATQTATAVPAISALGATWMAVVSVNPANGTPVSAKSNTQTDPAADGAGVPIYNLAGAIVANNYADLWDKTIQNPIELTELGTSPPDQGGDKHLVWTGTTSSGDATGWSLLVPNSWKYFGDAWLTDTSVGTPLCSWIGSLGPQQGWSWDGGTEKTPMPIYVMSGILTVK